MAYMEDQAEERDQIRQRMLGGQAPEAMPQQGISLGGLPANFDIGQLLQSLAQSLTPGKVRETATPELQVPMTAPIRTGPPAPEQWRGDDVDLGSALSGIFDRAKGSALQDMLRNAQKGASTRDRSTSGAAERAQRLRDTTPGPYAKGEAATQYVQSMVPGLKPGIPTPPPTAEGKPTAPPSEPAARAYQEQQRTDIPPTVMTEKGTTPAGYEEDLKFLSDRNGHNSKLVDGKIVDVPLSEEGNYKKLEPEMAARLAASGRAFEAETGKKAVYGEFSRGEDVQKIYRDKFEAGGGRAAKPGQSRHQHGGAGDIQGADYREWLTKNKDTYGLHFPFSDDRVHVQYDPAYKGQTHIKPAQSPITKDLPAWDKGLPQTDAKTNWPAPSATTPADQIKATPVATGPQAASGDQTLAAQRAEYKAQADANPSIRETMAAIMISESSTPEGQQGTAEAMMNRVKANNRPFTEAMDPNYHADYMVKNKGKFNDAVAKIRNDPALRKQIYDLQDKAFAGSNVSKLATDYAGKGVAENSAKTSTETYASPDGQRFFRKDLDPVNDGPGQVAANKKWHAETSAAMAKPTAPAGPGTGPLADAADVGKPEAMLRDAAVPGKAGTVEVQKPSEVFEKGAEAVPAPGVGGLQEDVDYAGMQPTARTTQDSAGEALNAIQKPEAPVAAVPDTTSAAVAPVPVAVAPPPAPAVTAPPPPPPKSVTPPPKSVTSPPAASPGLSKAHALLDMTAGEFVGKYAPEHLGKVKFFGYTNTPMREVVKVPGVGKQVIDGLAPHMSEHGMTMQDFQKAMTQPSPGRQSQAPPGYRSIAPGLMPETAPQTFKPSPYEGATQSPDVIDRRGQAGRGRLELGTKLGMNPNPGMDQHWYNEPEVAERVAQETPLSKALGADDIERSVSTRLDAMRAEAKATPPYTPQPPTAQEIEANRPALPPGIADALVQSVQEQGPPIDMKPPPPEALPVLPATDIAPPAPGAPGGLGLAPPGLDIAAPGAGPFQTAMGVPGSQGGGIATLGVLPQIQNSTFTTPLLDSMARQPTVGQGNLAPFSWSMPASWGWNTGGSPGGGFDMGSSMGASAPMSFDLGGGSPGGLGQFGGFSFFGG